MMTLTTPADALTWSGAYTHRVRTAGPVGSYRSSCGIKLDRLSSETIVHGRAVVDCPACIEAEVTR